MKKVLAMVAVGMVSVALCAAGQQAEFAIEGNAYPPFCETQLGVGGISAPCGNTLALGISWAKIECNQRAGLYLNAGRPFGGGCYFNCLELKGFITCPVKEEPEWCLVGGKLRCPIGSVCNAFYFYTGGSLFLKTEDCGFDIWPSVLLGGMFCGSLCNTIKVEGWYEAQWPIPLPCSDVEFSCRPLFAGGFTIRFPFPFSCLRSCLDICCLDP